jgi:hypothetical protein
MAVTPGTYNFSLKRRADYSLMLQFKDGTVTPINLTGWVVDAEVWNKDRTVKYADFAVEYTDRSIGKVKLSLTEIQTTTFPDEAYYDVLLTNPSDLKEYYLGGAIYVSQGYTT